MAERYTVNMTKLRAWERGASLANELANAACSMRLPLGKGSSTPTDADEAELRIQPVARVEMQKAEAVKTDGKPRTGEAIYASVCKACHETGVAGAPKTQSMGSLSLQNIDLSQASLKISLRH